MPLKMFCFPPFLTGLRDDILASSAGRGTKQMRRRFTITCCHKDTMRSVLHSVCTYSVLLLIRVTSSQAQQRIVDKEPISDIDGLLLAVNATGLPRWEEHVTGLPLCPREVPVHSGRYFIDDQKKVQFEPATCRLRRLSAREARLYVPLLQTQVAGSLRAGVC